MSAHIIKVPDIGEGIAQVELAEWHVQPGDSVVEDQLLADVMTDKATVGVPSPVAGKVISLGGEAGELLAVGAELIRLETEIEDKAGASPAEEKAPAAAPEPATAPRFEPARSKVATQPAPVSESQESRVPEFHAANKPLASPSVRRHARELAIELQNVQGSGPDGRIMHEDLDAFIARGTGSAVPQQGAMGYGERHDEKAVPIIGLRRKIAQKMQESKRHIPHFTYVEEIDVTELEALRTRLNSKWGSERGRLTLLPLVIRAMVLAVREFPHINARFDDEANIVTHYGAVHMGIATQTPHGLIVPVLRHAEARDLWACAAEVTRLADAARTGLAKREELSGSTITISSLGPLGGIAATPIINYPEVAIVGVNRIVERPVIVNGAVVARKMMNLSSSFDHRVVDGLNAAEFIQAVRRYLECPATLFID